ncbi:MAG TPA: Crp/Fnr family transcriptional regulator [Thermoanaerobaculia bacterium]|nr:Crp/Fnr family transcriptional regulator [Thermoanaerobaculia bacterium]
MKKASSNAVNRLLAVLPADVRRRFEPGLERVGFELKEVLYGNGKPLSHVYFPINSVISLLTVMENGDAIEVATVGNEGFVGVPALLGFSEMLGSAQALSQIPGESLRMGLEAFREALREEPALNLLLLRYANTFFLDVAQSTACNRLHSIDERCCRWLLNTHDRVSTDYIPLTQEFLAQMLGVRRASVNAVAGLLQRMGLIRYSRGRITILDREGLEKGACECYSVIRKEFERLLEAPRD